MTQDHDLDLREQGKGKDGETIYLDRRLYMQLLAYGNCQNIGPVMGALEEASVQGALYADLNDPQGVAFVAMSEDANYFVSDLRHALNQPPFTGLTPKPEFTMFGRTYAIGYETDLERAVISRPYERVIDPEQPWAIWYPLRRRGEFETLPEKEQRLILMEHGGIGHTFGKAGYATDIRLACFGLDKNDNDFVIGVLGKELHPLSAVIQRMRKTKQTAQYIEKLGPFFVGKAIWQSQGVR
ncbi:MAG: chlorite dismutase family protein [Anaerolineae bacterium]|nr:chlorite dismutase family protein [Anaerolineae bacterium]